MKKNKLDNGGFVLVETLIVSIFVMSIFAILYNNFYPIMGEFEKREVYDEVDAKYAAYWIKRLVQDIDVKFTTDQLNSLDASNTSSPGYFMFDCSMLGSGTVKEKTCNRVLNASQVWFDKDASGNPVNPHIYITTYNLKDFKTKIESSNDFSGGMHRYVGYLPEYTIPSMNDAMYRVIVEFHRTRDDNDYLAYATFEVKK